MDGDNVTLTEDNIVMKNKIVDKDESDSSPASKRNKLDPEYCPEVVCAAANIFRKSGEFCDFKIKVANVEYPVHKMVLAAFSPYFKAFFSSNSSAIHFEGDRPVLCIKDVEASVMGEILQYAYLGKIQITKNNVSALFQAANLLQVKSLFKMCCGFLENDIGVENSLGVWSLAEAYSCHTLRVKAKTFSLKNFAEVSEECEFLELAQEKLLDLISDDSLAVEKEDDVLKAVLQWMYYKEESRMEHFDTVLRQVRLAYVDIAFLNDRFLQDKVLRKSENCMRLVEEANKYNLLTNRRIERQSSIARRRTSSTEFEAMMVSYERETGGIATSSGTFFVTEDGRVLKSLEISDSDDYELLPSNYNIMVHTDDFEAMWRYNLSTNECISIAPFVKKRNQVAVCELDGLWYSIGGWHGGQAWTDVECYNPWIDIGWSSLAPLPEAVYEPACVSLEGFIYIVGGHVTNTMPSRALQQFNPRRNQWTQLTPLPLRVRLQFPRACAINRRIYVGSSTSRRLHVYDVSTQEWSQSSNTKYGIVSGPVVLNGSIYVLTEGKVRQLERYWLETNTWQEFAIFPGIIPYRLEGPFLFKGYSKNETDVEVTLLRSVQNQQSDPAWLI